MTDSAARPGAAVASPPIPDPTPGLDELRAAHDLLAPVYAERLAGILDQMPYERAVLDLFCEWLRDVAPQPQVADLGCGTGRLVPYLTDRGLGMRGLDLSAEMIRIARRDVPGVPFAVGDLRALPYPDASLDGVVCWYSYMYLPAAERTRAFAELGRVVRPDGRLVAAFKLGGDEQHRGGRTLTGIEFDLWWHSHQDWSRQLDECGFDVTFWAGRPAEPDELQPQGYLVARRRAAV